MKRFRYMQRNQRGLAAVETSIVALVALMTLIGVLEVARAFFVFNALEEATRRGARVAAVCQVNDAAIAQITVLNPSGVGPNSTLISGLTTGNVVVQYLDQFGNVLPNPMGSFGLISFVRVSIVNYVHQLLIPLFITNFVTPTFETTLPAESLGVWPGGFSPC